MTRDEILEYFKDINHAYNDCTRYDTLKRMLDELQEPCADTISREETLKALKKFQYVSGFVNMGIVRMVLHNIPPVTPAEKVGQWLCSGDKFIKWGVCSLCKENSYEPFAYAKMHFNYCPHCGAKMGGTQHDD